MNKNALQMLINDVIEFSDSDWAIVPVFARSRLMAASDLQLTTGTTTPAAL